MRVTVGVDMRIRHRKSHRRRNLPARIALHLVRFVRTCHGARHGGPEIRAV